MKRKPLGGVEIFIERDKVSINDKCKYKGNLLFFSLVLIGIVIIFSYGVGNVSAAASGSTIYVNGSGGHDTSNGSSWLYAKKSIKNATGTVTTNGQLIIANGIYTGTKQVNINTNMTIKGQSTRIFDSTTN